MRILKLLLILVSLFYGLEHTRAKELLKSNDICTDSITITGDVIGYQKSLAKLSFGIHMNGFIKDVEARTTQVDANGHFSLRIPLTFRLQILDFGLIGNDITPSVGYVIAEEKSPIQIDFVYENKQFKPHIQGDPIFSGSDQENVSSVLDDIQENFVKVNAGQFKLSTDAFLKLQLDSLLPHALKRVLGKYNFSEKGRCYMDTNLRLFYICHCVLKYGKGTELYLEQKKCKTNFVIFFLSLILLDTYQA